MVWFTVLLFLYIVSASASIGQANQFEYECDILVRLDLLENELQLSKEKETASSMKLDRVENELKATTETLNMELEDIKNELEESKARLESVEAELKQSTEKLESVENELKIANETLAVSDFKLTEIVDALQSLQNQLKGNTSSGSTYVRWGRSTCPGNGTELVYSGSTGGSHFDHSGAAADNLCLPDTPLYGKYSEDASQRGGYVYGARYVFGRSNPMEFFPDLADDTVFQPNDVPCAVCRTHRSTVLMIPARNTCMDGWTLEYKGLLFTGYFDHAAANEYICLDDQPEFRNATGSTSYNGKLMYFVESHCGTLSCPPYVYGRELSCAVCSK